MSKLFAKLPAGGPATLEVPLYPRSAKVLLDLLESAEQTYPSLLREAPGYVVIDVANFRNQLAAHLQRVAVGE